MGVAPSAVMAWARSATMRAVPPPPPWVTSRTAPGAAGDLVPEVAGWRRGAGAGDGRVVSAGDGRVVGAGDDWANGAAGGCPVGEAGGVEAAAGGGQRVGGDVGGDAGAVGGVALVQDGEVTAQELGAGAAERDAAEMGHERGGDGDVAPAEGTGAFGKIVFLAVALGKGDLIELAGLRQAVGADEHAEAVGGGDVDRGAGIGAGGEPGQAVGLSQAGRWVAAVRVGVAEDAGLVGQRGGGADVRRAAGGVAQGFEPEGGDQGVAVEQDGVVAGGGGEAGVGGGGEAEVAGGVGADEVDAAVLGEVGQSLGEVGVGGVVVHHGEAVGGGQGGQDGSDAVERGVQAAVDGNDDVDREGGVRGALG